MPREASRVGQTEREDSFHSYYWKFDFYSFMCYNINIYEELYGKANFY